MGRGWNGCFKVGDIMSLTISSLCVKNVPKQIWQNIEILIGLGSGYIIIYNFLHALNIAIKMRWAQLLITLSHHTHISLARSWIIKPLRGHGREAAPWQESRDRCTNGRASGWLLRSRGRKCA